MGRIKGTWALTFAIGALLVLGASGAWAAGHVKSCGANPNRLTWNLEARGTTCKAARQLAYHGAKGKPKKVRAHVFGFTTPSGWKCLYTVFHSTHAQDSEGEIFDCHMGQAVVRWSDSPEIEPHSLR